MLSPEIKNYIDKSILCWLATSSDNRPNVSPKEIFTYYNDKYVLIANIASPKSVSNIKVNSNVCVSFVDILVQKGFQLKGQAKLIRRNDSKYETYAPLILNMTKGLYPFSEIIEIEIMQVKPILAPSYIMNPNTLEVDQIAQAKKAYGFE